jgi:hypothetical protein
MKKSGEYGDHLMMYAAAAYTKCQIEVVSSTSTVKNYIILLPGEVEGRMVIGHIADFHFVILE